MSIETKEQAGGIQTATDDFGTIPDCPVRATATCWLCQWSTVKSTQRPFLRLQRPTFSDPKMHRATSETQKECEWKQGQRVVFRNSSRIVCGLPCETQGHMVLRYEPPKTGPPQPAVNGPFTEKTGAFSLDREVPSHGSNTGPGYAWGIFPARSLDFVRFGHECPMNLGYRHFASSLMPSFCMVETTARNPPYAWRLRREGQKR